MSELIPESTRQYRRDVRRQIVLPVLLPSLFLILLAVVVLILAVTDQISEAQISIVAGSMGCLFVLLPLVLLMFVINAILLLIALGAGKIHGLVLKPLRIAQEYATKGASLTHDTSKRITEPVIDLRMRVAGWRYMLMGFFGLENGTVPEKSASSIEKVDTEKRE